MYQTNDYSNPQAAMPPPVQQPEVVGVYEAKLRKRQPREVVDEIWQWLKVTRGHHPRDTAFRVFLDDVKCMGWDVAYESYKIAAMVARANPPVEFGSAVPPPKTQFFFHDGVGNYRLWWRPTWQPGRVQDFGFAWTFHFGLSGTGLDTLLDPANTQSWPGLKIEARSDDYSWQAVAPFVLPQNTDFRVVQGHQVLFEGKSAPAPPMYQEEMFRDETAGAIVVHGTFTTP
ncbi:hypothetical protein C8F01DRAFT_1369282 [Mycena amicta]|nr:hypothetical protein C8F01DRAFT_1369282 [Mycena amicta]